MSEPTFKMVLAFKDELAYVVENSDIYGYSSSHAYWFATPLGVTCIGNANSIMTKRRSRGSYMGIEKGPYSWLPVKETASCWIKR